MRNPLSKSRLRSLFIALAGGLFLTLAVAIACARFGYGFGGSNEGRIFTRDGQAIALDIYSDAFKSYTKWDVVEGAELEYFRTRFPATKIGAVRPAPPPFWSLASYISLATSQDARGQSTQIRGGKDVAVGWPFRCLRCSQTKTLSSALSPFAPVLGEFPTFGTPGRTRFVEEAPIPLRPIALGLALNTIFFAVAMFVPITLFKLIQATRRRGKGLCAKCGYNLCATPPSFPCPECGTVRPAASPSPPT